MKRIFVISLLLTFTLASAVSAEPACPCFPDETTWIVKYCETWNCAASAVVMADGDPYVMAVPTADSNFRWVVVRRVVSSSVIVSPDEPFEIELFPTVADAAVRHAGIETGRVPMIIAAPDGRVLVIALKADAKNKRRTVRH